MLNETRLHSSLAFAGNSILPVLKTIYVNKEEGISIWQQLSSSVHPVDLLVILILVYVPIPLYCLFYKRKGIPHNESFFYQVAKHVSIAARMAIIVYAFDCSLVILVGMGVQLEKVENLPVSLAKALYMSWAAARLQVFKRYLLGKYFASKKKLRFFGIVDHLLDGVICFCTVCFLYDILEYEMGIGVSSVLTLGSIGTLAFGLAAQNLITMTLSGLALYTADNFQEGDLVVFGNGTEGCVHNLGWMETTIRGSDNLLEVIPNSTLGMQSVKNYSRVAICQVKETLRLRYEDAEKLPKICKDILVLIEEVCAEVITDGTKAFQANWTGYRQDHLEVVVNTHYNLKPTSAKCRNNREKVLMAIHQAVKKNSAQFVTTWWPKE